mgnify:CR=1 FL=1
MILKKKFRFQVLVHTSPKEHEEALEKVGDEPGRACSTNNSASSDEDAVSSDLEEQDTAVQNSKEVGDDGNEEQADAKNGKGLRNKTALT